MHQAWNFPIRESFGSGADPYGVYAKDAVPNAKGAPVPGPACLSILKSVPGSIDVGLHILYGIQLLFLTSIIFSLYCLPVILSDTHHDG
jgi:hypothetical protein